MLAALAIDCPTGALAPVSGTSSATRFCSAWGSGAGLGGGVVFTARSRKKKNTGSVGR